MSLSLSDSLSFAEIPLVKLVHVGKIQLKYLWICIFQTLNHLFLLFRGVCAKCPFYKKELFLREDFFETNLDLSRHPQQVFWFLSPFFKYLFSIFVFTWVIGELRELCWKFWNSMIKIHAEIIGQSWPLLTLFYSGPIVQCGNASDATWWPILKLMRVEKKI